MNKSLRVLAIAFSVFALGVAQAYKITDVGSDRKDVYCEGGAFVGSMFWNGSKWSDGLRSDVNPDVVAKQMVAAQGSSCR